MQMCVILMVGERGEETGTRRIQSGIIQSRQTVHFFMVPTDLSIYYRYYYCYFIITIISSSISTLVIREKKRENTQKGNQMENAKFKHWNRL